MNKKWQDDLELQARKLHVLASIAMGGGFALFGIADFFTRPLEMWVHLSLLRLFIIALIVPTAFFTHRRRLHVNVLAYLNILSMSLFLSYVFSATELEKPDNLVIDMFIFFVASAYSVVWHSKHTVVIAFLFLSFHLPLALSLMSWETFLSYNGLWTVITPFLVALIVHYRFTFIKREIELRHRLMEQNEEINQQKEELMTQHQTVSTQRNQLDKAYKQITDSIRYAKRIQDALLPSLKFLNEHFYESFIYFKPRDIVSGDFYWFAEKEDKVVVVVADCTGHGIPGSLMSMIGDSILNQIIHDKEIHSPDMVLAHLHRRVRSTLRQDQNNSRDGMDMVILSLFKAEKPKKYTHAEYAGAMNPLFYVQENTLHEIKATKKAIGGSDYKNKGTYDKHTILLDKPTTFYLFSDGFQDQFGGEGKEAKKFTIRQFRELLQKISILPLKVQNETLEEVYQRWTDEERFAQIDDILIIGLKV